MDNTNIATTIAFISGLFTLAGVTGVSANDIAGFVNVIFGIVTLVSIVVAHYTHKNAVANQ